MARQLTISLEKRGACRGAQTIDAKHKDPKAIMTHPESAHSSGATLQPTFPASEWKLFQTQDRQAARNIVCLMTTIFIFGVFLYLFITYTVAESPNFFR